MQSPPQLDLTAYAGATFDYSLTWLVNGVPQNLTGYTAAMQVRAQQPDPSTVLSLSSPSNGITLGGTAGVVTINVTPVQTALLEEGQYVYDLLLTNGSTGYAVRLVEGDFYVEGAVTR